MYSYSDLQVGQYTQSIKRTFLDRRSVILDGLKLLDETVKISKVKIRPKMHKEWWEFKFQGEVEATR